MWEGSHTDLLSGKSMFIDMHDIDSPDRSKSAFCFTVIGTPGEEPRKELL